MKTNALPQSKIRSEFRRVRKEAAKRLIIGVVYEPDFVDLQNDFADADEIQKAAHRFLVDYRKVRVMHEEEAPRTDIVESYIAPQTLSIDGMDVRKGTWIVAIKVNDDALWKKVQDGEYKGLSLGGTAHRQPYLSKSATGGRRNEQVAMTKLADLIVEEISIVDEAANAREFIFKRNSQPLEEQTMTTKDVRVTTMKALVDEAKELSDRLTRATAALLNKADDDGDETEGAEGGDPSAKENEKPKTPPAAPKKPEGEEGELPEQEREKMLAIAKEILDNPNSTEADLEEAQRLVDMLAA